MLYFRLVKVDSDEMINNKDEVVTFLVFSVIVGTVTPTITRHRLAPPTGRPPSSRL